MVQALDLCLQNLQRQNSENYSLQLLMLLRLRDDAPPPLKKTRWDCVKNDMESLGLSQTDAQFKNKWRMENYGGNWLTRVHLEKWPLKRCVCVCVCVAMAHFRFLFNRLIIPRPYMSQVPESCIIPTQLAATT